MTAHHFIWLLPPPLTSTKLEHKNSNGQYWVTHYHGKKKIKGKKINLYELSLGGLEIMKLNLVHSKELKSIRDKLK